MALASLVWRDERWLAMQGEGGLGSHNVVDYVLGSPFARGDEAEADGEARAERAAYRVLHEQAPHLFVVGRFDSAQAAAGATAGASPASVFYIIDGAVYMAPSLHAVVASRAARCAQLVEAAWGALCPP